MTVTTDLEARIDNNISVLSDAENEQVRIYGQRYLDYREDYILANNHEKNLDFPLYLMLEQTYKCNLKCPSCIQGDEKYRGSFITDSNIMSLELFEKIVLEGEKNNCPSIAFHVNDEPLLVKNLAERISFAKQHGFMDLIMTTNGNLLTYDLMRKIIDAGITHVLFSIDAATPETYNAVRPGGDFQKVVNNIKALMDYKISNNLSLPITRASFVANRDNLHEKELFIDKFSKSVDFIEVQTLSSYYEMNADLIPYEAEKVEDLKCSEPWVRLIIRANGDVLPCCSFYGYEIVLGNINELSLKEIYNGKKCKKLKSEIKNSIYSLESCMECSKSLYKTT